VWLARDRELGITVAVKVLHKNLHRCEVVLAKFAREAELSARMMSPNIVRVLARGVDAEETPYIAYELLDGEDLSERLDRERTMSIADAETVVVHVARALARAHAVGVIHRDVKPENIFATKDEDARPLYKVLDFGIAELTVNLKERGAEIAGTLEYIAPEVLVDARTPDVRSDLYSLAVVAYRCVTGRVPFPGETLGQVLLAVTKTKPPPPSELCPAATKELDDWFAQALARDPAHRFQNAKAMTEAFHRAAKASRPAAPVDSLPPMRPRMQSFAFDSVEIESVRRSSPNVPAFGGGPQNPKKTTSPRVPLPPTPTPPVDPAPPSVRPRYISVVEIDETTDDDTDARRR
jgi:serine/threonine-protein kinase